MELICHLIHTKLHSQEKNFIPCNSYTSTNTFIIWLVISDLSQDIITVVKYFFPLQINYKPDETFKVTGPS